MRLARAQPEIGYQMVVSNKGQQEVVAVAPVVLGVVALVGPLYLATPAGDDAGVYV